MRNILTLFILWATAAVPSLAQSLDTTTYSHLRWRNVGMLRGGRSVAVTGSAARPDEYWMGTTGGGVFKTTDGGTSWTPMSDKYFGGTIGAIAVAPSNPNIVYVGGGEFPIRGNVSHGDGVYKTTDGGRTWRYMGLVETRHIAKIRIHPGNPDLVYVAALGQVFSPNAERGIYKSIDGGETWRRVLFRNDSTGAVDLTMDPNDPRILYAGLWQAGRTPWKLVSGGVGSGIFKSTDGGETWTEITRNPGLPGGLIGNIGISVSPVQRGRVWALIEADSGGVFLSDDAGATWTKVNSERKLRQRAWYYSRIYADTKDANTVYASNTSFQRSTDGGRTWTGIRTPHGDSHDMWMSPDDNQRFIEGNDGGGNITRDAGRTWTEQDYRTAQFYHVTTTNHFPYRICGAQQDNSTLCGASRPVFGSNVEDWYDVGGGESGYIAVRPDNPDVVYAGSYGGYLSRKDVRTGITRSINPFPMNPMGHSAEDIGYRFQWTFPIVISPHDPSVLYAAANVIFRSRDEGQSFEIMSPDLTRHDPATLGPSGGPITKDQTSVEYYATIFSLAESPLERGVLWTGSDDGMIYITRDDGETWTNVTPPDLPEWTRISIIDASAHRRGTAFVAGNRYQLGDFSPYLYRTTDYGASWTRIDSGIRRSDFTRVIREDPAREGLLYAGTERGVWVSFDDGAHWQTLQLNLPPVPVHDLVIHDADVVIGTHGRSFWVLDDISTLRQLTPAVVESDVKLFAPTPAYRMFGTAKVSFWLKDAGKRVQLEFLDPEGKVVGTFSSDRPAQQTAGASREEVDEARVDSLRNLGVLPASVRAGGPPTPSVTAVRGRGPAPTPRVTASKGMNTFSWNMRHADATRFPGMIFWAAGTSGPVVAPGSYQVRLTVGDVVQTQALRVLRDPRTDATDADVQEQVALLLQIRDKTTEANDAVRLIRQIKSDLVSRTADAGSRAGGLTRTTASFIRDLSAVEGEIYQVRNESNQDPLNFPIRLNNKIAALAGVVGGAEARPTKQSYEVFEMLSDSLAIQTRRLAEVIRVGLPRVNDELERLGLIPIAAVLRSGDDEAEEREGQGESEGASE